MTTTMPSRSTHTPPICPRTHLFWSGIFGQEASKLTAGAWLCAVADIGQHTTKSSADEEA